MFNQMFYIFEWKKEEKRKEQSEDIEFYTRYYDSI